METPLFQFTARIASFLGEYEYSKIEENCVQFLEELGLISNRQYPDFTEQMEQIDIFVQDGIARVNMFDGSDTTEDEEKLYDFRSVFSDDIFRFFARINEFDFVDKLDDNQRCELVDEFLTAIKEMDECQELLDYIL
jgi:hypothetical protein